jgi:hypothetical protein
MIVVFGYVMKSQPLLRKQREDMVLIVTMVIRGVVNMPATGQRINVSLNGRRKVNMGIHVEANQFATRRTRNHVNRGLQALRLNRSGDWVLLCDDDGKPMAWVPVNEIRELPKWMGEK